MSDDANEPTPEESTLPAAEEADEAEPQPEQAPASEPVAESAPTADDAPAAEPVETASIAESEPARRGARATTPRSEMEAALEAILFVAPEPLSRERLIELFDEPERAEAAEALAAVLARHGGGEGRGIMIEEVGGGIRLASRPELNGYLKRFYQVTGRSRLSMAALETLAIIAYRQPLTGPEISDLRSAQSGAVLKTLLERRLIRIAGRKEVVGKPFLYATTREFLLHFGLQALKDLPPLEEADELFGADAGGGEAPIPDREEEIAREADAIESRDEQSSDASDSSEQTADETFATSET